MTEVKVTAAYVGAGGAGVFAVAVIWLAQRYLGLELTEVQAAVIVTAITTGAARLFGWLKPSSTSRVSEGYRFGPVPSTGTSPNRPVDASGPPPNRPPDPPPPPPGRRVG